MSNRKCSTKKNNINNYSYGNKSSAPSSILLTFEYSQRQTFSQPPILYIGYTHTQTQIWDLCVFMLYLISCVDMKKWLSPLKHYAHKSSSGA